MPVERTHDLISESAWGCLSGRGLMYACTEAGGCMDLYEGALGEGLMQGCHERGGDGLHEVPVEGSCEGAICMRVCAGDVMDSMRCLLKDHRRVPCTGGVELHEVPWREGSCESAMCVRELLDSMKCLGERIMGGCQMWGVWTHTGCLTEGLCEGASQE